MSFTKRSETVAALIATEFNRLDVLVNNAGINAPGDGPPNAVDLSVVRRVMETNFFGAVTVTQAMLPLLRKAPVARIVNVSSGLGSLTWNADLIGNRRPSSCSDTTPRRPR